MAGYIYVLIHPSDPDLYKIGITINHPKKRLAAHNRDFAKHAGRIVKETGQKWLLKEFHEVVDPNWAEIVFWGATGIGDLPYRYGVEVERMEWKTVQMGLSAALKAGRRPPKPPKPTYWLAYRAWMNKRLVGRGITLVGDVRSKYGRSDFRCSNGHEWRTVPNAVAEGAGCPECGAGECDPDAIRKAARAGFLFLMVHPDQPGVIRIRVVFDDGSSTDNDPSWVGWEVHRYRSVEEPELAISIMSDLLGIRLLDESQRIPYDLEAAEQAMRELHDRMVSEIVLVEQQRDAQIAAEPDLINRPNCESPSSKQSAT